MQVCTVASGKAALMASGKPLRYIRPGGGASILAVYAHDKDGDQVDEIGSGEYDPGMTVSVSFTF